MEYFCNTKKRVSVTNKFNFTIFSVLEPKGVTRCAHCSPSSRCADSALGARCAPGDA